MRRLEVRMSLVGRMVPLATRRTSTSSVAALFIVAALALTVRLCGEKVALAQSCSGDQSCPGDVNGDGTVTIDEIIKVVNAALNGCGPSNPTPTPNPAARFVDNSDGTITDTQTGLMWEKKVGLDGIPGGLHDVDNDYPWAGVCYPPTSFPQVYCQRTATAAAACAAAVDGDATACGVCTGGLSCADVSQGYTTNFSTIWDWVSQLNSAGGFAGHTDWRVPTLSELASINDAVNYNTLLGNGIFNQTGCSTACADLTSPACSCTKPGQFYWSATTSGSTDAWLILPGIPAGSDTLDDGMSLETYVRAVRGGS